MSVGINNVLPFILVFINTVILGSTHLRLWTFSRPTARRIQALSGCGPEGRSQPELPGLSCIPFKILLQQEPLSRPLEIPWTSSSSESES